MHKIIGVAGFFTFTAILSPLTAADPLAWIHFTRHDKQTVLYNGFYMYYADREKPLEFTIDVPPDPDHKLAFQWVAKHGAIRSMVVEINGKQVTLNHAARGNGQQPFFWKVIPVADFGIKKKKDNGNYQLRILYPKNAEDDAVIAGFRLIKNDSQLVQDQLALTRHKVTPVSPGVLSAQERLALRVDRKSSRQRIHAQWVGKEKLTDAEIKNDEFLAAAVKFGDTVITHGRDTYGPKKTPMFVKLLHRERLESPATICFQPPALGGPSHPVVQTQFDRSQNLLRTLAGISQATGNPKYAEAASDALIHMFEEFSAPGSGLFIFGHHMTIDLEHDRAYSDGRSGDIFELGSVFPFYQFWHSVDPKKTEQFIKGCWEAFVRDWHTMHYNRHASFHKQVNFTQTWHRPLLPVKDLPEKMEVLGFLGVGLDIAQGGYYLGCLHDDAKPRAWAKRYYEVLSYHRDAKTNIWPMLLYTPSIRRNLEVYWEDFPDANVTEPRVIISSWIHSMPMFFLGSLGSVEMAKLHGHNFQDIHTRIDEWILGYMAAAYDRKNHELRSIILDGTDVTDHVFKPGKALHGWGAREGDSFAPQTPGAKFFVALAKAYRLAGNGKKESYWSYLRDFFKGAKFGDIGAKPGDKPAFNPEVIPEPAHILSLVDIYRVHQHPELLKFIEHLGRKLIASRHDPKSGLFSRPPGYRDTYRSNKNHREPWECISTSEKLREFGYERPMVVALDVIEPLALLAVHACRTGRFENIPQWLGGGQWGSDDDGHIVSTDHERWFDRDKLKMHYEKQSTWLQAKGYAINKRWFPEQEGN
ncbi:MAG: hypothetical protein GY899_11610 [Verrucomicrobiaceae bacterium]|nr:hypothetical protein [Verrucomicrobiaceae bacterium]